MSTTRGMALVALIGALAGCGHKREAPPIAPPPAPAPAVMPLPPAGSAPGQSLPDAEAATINSGIGAEEALWHLRAGLNVAALACGDAAVVTQYNGWLVENRVALKQAYAAENAAHPGKGELDRHMTQLYNFFAQPPAQRRFCAAASGVAGRVSAPGVVPAGEAPGAVVELETPIRDYYRAYGDYRRALAAWQAQGAARLAAAEATPTPALLAAAATPAPAAPWRIQIGAFTGRAAAEAAWARARDKVPSLAKYDPYYEPVPGRPLVRVQVGAANDRASALGLCASAAAGGFDCIPVVGAKAP
ncbi:hypothetical protein GGQ80_002604 [Sphingomonas jinjuensis]|uniref:SPOR domain-containing protein n=1 Tax=Sphingomonas jinjuensis TaxID=535907 RepID=A0A840FL84_9SPHN|nr:SPOR domain-containing protein [Sphingomonas jinjuensis]MBB4154688.1 hypothetical protein [Sphingomonas jinjuensis]